MQAKLKFLRYPLLILLLSAAIVALLVACSDKADDANTATQQAAEYDPSAALSSALSEYTIVRGDSSGNPILKGMLDLRTAIRNKCQKTLPLSTDFAPDEGKPEILIGMTNRKASIDVAAEMTENTRFILRAVENKIVILANTRTGLSDAVQYFATQYLSGKTAAVSEINHTELTDDIILMNKNHSFRFVVPDNTSDEFMACCTKMLESLTIPEFSLVRASYNAGENGVFIGKIPQNTVSTSYSDIIKEHEYIGRAAAGSVHLQGKSDLLTLMAFGDFITNLPTFIDYDFEGNLCLFIPLNYSFNETWEFAVPKPIQATLDNSESITSTSHIFYYSGVTSQSFQLFKQMLNFIGFHADPVVNDYYYQNNTQLALGYLSRDMTLSVVLTNKTPDTPPPTPNTSTNANTAA